MKPLRAAARCPAKINLFLDVLEKRADGFHDLETLFVAIDLFDDLEIEAGDGITEDSLTVDGPAADGVPADGSNLVRKGIDLFRREFAPHLPPVRAHLTKRIPARAGLGGGSSNAAGTLRILSYLSRQTIPRKRMMELALFLGSDSPFFYDGGVQFGSARGEKLRPVLLQQPAAFVVVVPDAEISTPHAFRSLAEEDKGPRTNRAAVEEWLEGKSLALPTLHNAFQRWAEETHPPVRAALGELKEHNAKAALLSGSGAACFGVFDSIAEARLAAECWESPARLVMACEPFLG